MFYGKAAFDVKTISKWVRSVNGNLIDEEETYLSGKPVAVENKNQT